MSPGLPRGGHPPGVFVSADSKRLSVSLSPLESTLMKALASVDSKGVRMCYQRCASFKEVLKYSLQVNKQDFEFAGERHPPAPLKRVRNQLILKNFPFPRYDKEYASA